MTFPLMAEVVTPFLSIAEYRYGFINGRGVVSDYTLSLTSPVLPGAIGDLVHSGRVQPHDAVTRVMTKGRLPVFLYRESMTGESIGLGYCPEIISQLVRQDFGRLVVPKLSFIDIIAVRARINLLYSAFQLGVFYVFLIQPLPRMFMMKLPVFRYAYGNGLRERTRTSCRIESNLDLGFLTRSYRRFFLAIPSYIRKTRLHVMTQRRISPVLILQTMGYFSVCFLDVPKSKLVVSAEITAFF